MSHGPHCDPGAWRDHFAVQFARRLAAGPYRSMAEYYAPIGAQDYGRAVGMESDFAELTTAHIAISDVSSIDAYELRVDPDEPSADDITREEMIAGEYDGD